ncbi:MAG: hypothetical protein WCJ30_13630 [Deltaproteobacteria bacterium]
MRFPWVIVGGTGYDVEELDNPRTHDMECPSCERTVRFVEKVLIKNLRVFGVALVGVEKGRRVFECPHCSVCVEPPDEAPGSPPTDPQIEALEARIRKLGDDVWLWGRRAQAAADKGVRDLEFEALEWKTKAEREVAALGEKLAALRAGGAAGARRAEREPATKGAAIVARKGGEVIDRGAEDDFAALKARLARKQADEAPASVAATEEGRKPADAKPEPADAPRASESGSTPARSETDIEDEFAALKARRAQREAGEPTSPPSASDADYESLRAELRDGGASITAPSDVAAASPGAPATPPTEPAPDGGEGGDDDPVAALKKKLRRK